MQGGARISCPGWKARRSTATGELRLQYLAGLALDEYRSDQIYSAMKGYRRYPESLFVEPGELEAELRLYYSR